MFCKKVILKASQNSQENTCVEVSFLKELNFIKKEAPAQIFSCEFRETFQSIFCYRTLPVAASAKPFATLTFVKKIHSVHISSDNFKYPLVFYKNTLTNIITF